MRGQPFSTSMSLPGYVPTPSSFATLGENGAAWDARCKIEGGAER